MPFNRPQQEETGLHNSNSRDVLRGVETSYMKLPMPQVSSTYNATPIIEAPFRQTTRNRNEILSDTEAIAEELDQLLHQFQYQMM